MGRPSVEINPLRGKRLNEIRREKKLKGYELADLLNMTPQTLSTILTGNSNLTRDRAQDVIKLFPEYYLPWLLGDSDIKYQEEATTRHHAYMEALEVQRMNREFSFFYHVSSLAEYVGFNSDFDDDTLTIEPSKEMSDYYDVVKLEDDNLAELKEDIIAFFKYRLAKTVKTGR